LNKQSKILIVDDEPFNVDYLEQELSELNYQTVTAVNGRDALEKVKAESPDLVLLDVMMPVMDGFAVLGEMKADPHLRDIPVIIISAMTDLQSVVRGIQQGAEDYLPKPFEPTLLRARIAASLEKKSLRDQQRKLLHTFATEGVAEELMRDGFTLGGRDMDVTIMFADIRSFTTFAEQHEAAEVIELLNDYFAAMFVPISKHGGVVNQIIGDGLMALFGVMQSRGDPCRQAVSAAIEMIQLLGDFNEKRVRNDKAPIKVGIGIASGKVMAGYAGTQHRATYTCVGDPVNLAARIEEYTKAAGKTVLIDKSTFEGLNGGFAVEDLGEIRFRGKNQSVNIYSVVVN
jgi:class 3 adenylate cyclase